MVFVLSHGFLGMSAENTHKQTHTAFWKLELITNTLIRHPWRKKEEVLLLHVRLVWLTWCATGWHPRGGADLALLLPGANRWGSEHPEYWQLDHLNWWTRVTTPKNGVWREHTTQKLQDAGGGVNHHLKGLKRNKATVFSTSNTMLFNSAKVLDCLGWLDKDWDRTHKI